jgi:hypothetical protein
VTVTVYVPSSAYVWLWAPIAPADDAVKTVFGLPSPQATVTRQGSSSPGSVKEPSENDLEVH